MVQCYRCGRAGHYATTCYAQTHRNGDALDTDDDDNDMYDDSRCRRRRTTRRPAARRAACTRCGRQGHTDATCYATTTADGDSLSSSEEEGDDCEDDASCGAWLCSHCHKAFDTEQGARYHELRWCTQRGRTSRGGAATNLAQPPRATSAQAVLGALADASRRGVYVLILDNGTRYVGKSEDVPTRIHQHRRGQGSAWCKQGGVRTLRQAPTLTPAQADLNVWEQQETAAQMMRHGCDRVRGWEFTRCDPLTPVERALYERLVFGLGDVCRQCGHTGHFAAGCRAAGGRGVAGWLREVRAAA